MNQLLSFNIGRFFIALGKSKKKICRSNRFPEMPNNASLIIKLALLAIVELRGVGTKRD